MVEKIRWSPRAINNLDSICAYIAKDSKFYAAIFAGKILNLIDEIHRHPKAGRIVPEYKNSNLRERIYKVIVLSIVCKEIL